MLGTLYWASDYVIFYQHKGDYFFCFHTCLTLRSVCNTHVENMLVKLVTSLGPKSILPRLSL
jgi:hypothetical protein